jgi:hypothetical protein
LFAGLSVYGESRLALSKIPEGELAGWVLWY